MVCLNGLLCIFFTVLSPKCLLDFTLFFVRFSYNFYTNPINTLEQLQKNIPARDPNGRFVSSLDLHLLGLLGLVC